MPYDYEDITNDTHSVVIFARRPIDDNPENDYLDIVLARSPGYQPWVTWLHNKSLGAHCYVAGHYHSDLAEAVRDYETRR
jgi:uncharacterized protein CbrC (UPF0167 family)